VGSDPPDTRENFPHDLGAADHALELAGLKQLPARSVICLTSCPGQQRLNDGNDLHWIAVATSTSQRLHEWPPWQNSGSIAAGDNDFRARINNQNGLSSSRV